MMGPMTFASPPAILPRHLIPSWIPGRRFNLVLLALLSGMTAAPLRAQTTDGVLTRVKDVLALPDDVAAAGTKAARLRGVVMDVTASRDEISLHDGEACVSVMISGAPTVSLGAEVEIEGSVFSEKFFERKRTRVKAAKFAMLGTRSLPEPKPASADDAAKFRQLDQWVSVEGKVLQVRISLSLLTIQIVDKSVSCNVLVRDWPRDAFPRDWIGGRVRVTGINRAYLPGSSFLSVVVPSAAQVTVLKSGVVDPMDAPVATVSALRQSDPGKAERVKLTGTVLGATPGNVFYARGEDGESFSFYMLHPIDEDKSGRFSTPIIMPVCKPGDLLEVVGIPWRVQPGVHLDFAVARVLRSAPTPAGDDEGIPPSSGDGKSPPPPNTAAAAKPSLGDDVRNLALPSPTTAAIPTDIATIAAGKHVHDLVEVHGRLLSFDDVLVAPGRWRTTMKLKDGNHTIIAFNDSSTRGALSHMELDHLLRVQGIVTGAPHFPEIRLWVRTPGDLQSLGIAMDAVTRRLWTGLGIAAVIVLMLVGWVFLLRRSRTAIREMNATLEQRVTARTTELAAAKDDLARALSQERELNELKTRFVSLVSHEFRTPLGIIMSAVEVLRHYGARITAEKHTELYEDIYSATRQMSGLMEQVLLLGRAEAGKIVWRPAPLDLPELCEKLVDEGLSATHTRCPVNLTTEGDFTGALMDESLLRHIIGNLLSNAVKYSPEGSPVDFKLAREGDDAVIIIQDHGIGIPAADQARLFEAFHRASNVGETPGTGLGLLLVKHCVELHHGKVSLQSQEGSGTTFTVRLPLRREA